MSWRQLALGALALAATGAGSAALADPRVAERVYRPSEITVLRGGPGIESTIAFAPDERVENIAVGDSVAWQVTPNKRANLIFVKPTSSRARTNMTVVTDQRTYLFDLVSGAAGGAVYMMRFSYPDGLKPAAKPSSTPIAAAEVASVTAPAPQPDPTLLNFAWASKGEKRLLPASLFDDGRSTFLRWEQGDALPAILARGTNGVEGPVNYTVKGDYIVVDGVPAQLVLRSGKHFATLTPAPRRPLPPTTTASAEPVRSHDAEAKP
ncbi:type VI secretion protein [Sphingomonas ginkgonis]|uniref:Type VI secretion protein n=1 Tax=Sphingomonas ginkgonis TaxID=2315330 RepID=A0A3R9WTK3_9SPHN|nr:TrbG/VirB9 family P-type conjugative transfer protein [Sphingomonas ginkgonis]RST31500.1 type VI secretion protein [Sphingomonas ginkgonis]